MAVGFPLEVFAAMRAKWPSAKPMGIRISATDWVDGGWNAEEAVVFARELKALGCDYIDVSTGGLDPRQQIPLSEGYQVPFSEKVRREAGIPTMSVGLIADARHAEDIVSSGKADLVVLGRGCTSSGANLTFESRLRSSSYLNVKFKSSTRIKYLPSGPYDSDICSGGRC